MLTASTRCGVASQGSNGATQRHLRVHVIAGGGRATPVLESLVRDGYQVSTECCHRRIRIISPREFGGNRPGPASFQPISAEEQARHEQMIEWRTSPSWPPCRSGTATSPICRRAKSATVDLIDPGPGGCSTTPARGARLHAELAARGSLVNSARLLTVLDELATSQSANAT